MRTIGNLLTLNGRIYVYLKSSSLSRLFLKNAEEEGFTFRDGVKPTEREGSRIFALNPDWTINYVGFVGHMAFQTAKTIGDQPLIKVDYGMYMAGREDYLL